MIKFIETKDLVRTVRSLVCKGNPRLAVAFWGAGAAENLGLLSIAPSCRIICNLNTGGTNPKEISVLLEAGANVRQNESLHAKVYLGSDGVVVGSSNASANGLSFQGNECASWTEANLFSPTGSLYSDLSRWFENLWKAPETRPITSEDLEQALILWSRRRRFRAPTVIRRRPVNLLEKLRSGIDDLIDRRVYVVIYSQNASQDACDRLKRKKQAIGGSNRRAKDLDFFENWEDLPDAADLICFYVGPRGGMRFDGVWQMPEKRMRDQIPSGCLLYCWKSDLPLKVDDLEEWRPILNKVTTRQDWDGNEVMEIGEFARKFLS